MKGRSIDRRVLWGAALASLLVGAHVAAAGAGLNVSGALLVADHLYRLLLVGGYVAVLGATGARLRGPLGLRAPSLLTRAVEAVAVGAGAWALLYLLLGAGGLLHPMIVGITLLTGAALLRRELARIPAAMRALAHDLLRGEEASWLRWTAIGATAAAAVFLGVRALPPPTAWDTLMYHLEIPQAFLDRGRIHLPPDNLHVAYVALPHLLYLPLLVLGGPPAPVIFASIFTILLAPVLLDLGRRHLGDGSGALAAAALWGFSIFLLVTGDGRVDGILTLFLLLAHGALLDAFRDARPAPVRRLAILLGLAFAVKYNAALYGLVLLPFAVWALFRLPRGARIRTGGVAVALAAVVTVPWMAKNQLLLGAPLYPFAAERVLPPWIGAAAGTDTHPVPETGELRSVIREARAPLNLRDLFTAPERLSPETEMRFFRLPLLLLLVPLGILARRRRRREWALLLVPAALYLGVLGSWRPQSNLRYLLPVAPALILCAAVGAFAVTRRVRPRLRLAFLVLLLSVSLAPTAAIVVGHLAWDRTPLHALGLRTPLQHLVEAFPSHALMIAYSEEEIPPDGRLLLLFEARGYYFPGEVLQDNIAMNWPLLVETGLTERCLQGTGITHVLVGTGPLRFYISRGSDPSAMRWERFAPFAERCLERVAGERSFEFYRVRGGPSDAGRPVRNGVPQGS